MNVKITPSKLYGSIQAPPSKSFAHRLMIAACFSGGRRKVLSVGESKDVYATANALRSLGADCKIENGDFYTEGFNLKKGCTVDCGESGSTLRFLIPVAAALGADAHFTGTEKLLSRPCGALLECLARQGVKSENFAFNGKFSGGKFHIDASVSSQYVTGLLLAAPLVGEDCEIVIGGKEASRPYIAITLSVLKESGIEVKTTENGFFIKGGQKYSLPPVTQTEGDWSGAAFALTAGAVGGSVTVTGLNCKSAQGDKKIIEILKDFGAKISVTGNSVSVEAPINGLSGITVDCENVPDLAQIISVAAAFAKGKTLLTGTENLKYKESDRTNAIINTLSAAGIKAETDGKSIVIFGGKPHGFTVDSGNDHRTAMSAAVLAFYAEGCSVIRRAEAVSKSYPNFFEDASAAGGKIDVSF